MATMRAARLPLVAPERRHLEAAHLRLFHLLHKRGWPAALDTALADRMRERLIHGRAVAIAREEHAAAELARIQSAPRFAGPTFDARRAQAGDLNDE